MISRCLGRSIHVDDVEIHTPRAFSDADIEPFVCFNTSSNSIVFSAQDADDTSLNYKWIELGQTDVSKCVLQDDNKTITLQIVPDANPDKISLPSGTEVGLLCSMLHLYLCGQVQAGSISLILSE
mgnify:CR=1 FL=1